MISRQYINFQLVFRLVQLFNQIIKEHSRRLIFASLASSSNITSNKEQNCTRLNTIFNGLEDIVYSFLIITLGFFAEMKIRKLNNTKLRIKIIAIHCVTSELLSHLMDLFYPHCRLEPPLNVLLRVPLRSGRHAVVRTRKSHTEKGISTKAPRVGRCGLSQKAIIHTAHVSNHHFKDALVDARVRARLQGARNERVVANRMTITTPG